MYGSFTNCTNLQPRQKEITLKKAELVKLLQKAGFEKIEGGNHEKWCKKGFPPIPVPRHAKDIPKGTLEKILKLAGLK